MATYLNSSRDPVYGAHDSAPTAIQDVGVDHGRLHVRVAEEFLHRPDVIAGLEQMSRERMSQRMNATWLHDVSFPNRAFDRAL
jgi:hypothetical protein